MLPNRRTPAGSAYGIGAVGCRRRRTQILDDAELVSLRISEYDESIVRIVEPSRLDRAEGDGACDICR